MYPKDHCRILWQGVAQPETMGIGRVRILAVWKVTVVVWDHSLPLTFRPPSETFTVQGTPCHPIPIIGAMRQLRAMEPLMPSQA